MTVMLLPTSLSGVGRRVGVTTTVGNATGSASALLSSAIDTRTGQTSRIPSRARAGRLGKSADRSSTVWPRGNVTRHHEPKPRSPTQPTHRPPVSIGAPRPTRSYVTTTDGRSPGSRVTYERVGRGAPMETGGRWVG